MGGPPERHTNADHRIISERSHVSRIRRRKNTASSSPRRSFLTLAPSPLGLRSLRHFMVSYSPKARIPLMACYSQDNRKGREKEKKTMLRIIKCRQISNEDNEGLKDSRGGVESRWKRRASKRRRTGLSSWAWNLSRTENSRFALSGSWKRR